MALLMTVFLLLAVGAFQFAPSQSASDQDLTVVGFFPGRKSSSWSAGGEACWPAANMAIIDVNDDPNLLPGYKLKIKYEDSKCDPTIAAGAMERLLNDNINKYMVLAGCEEVCAKISDIAKSNNIIVLCYGPYGLQSQAVTDRFRHPTLFHVYPSPASQNAMVIKVIEKYGWAPVAVFVQQEPIFVSTAEELKLQLKKSSFRDKHDAFRFYPVSSDPKIAVLEAKKDKAEVFVVFGTESVAQSLLCLFHEEEMHGIEYKQIFVGSYSEHWYTKNPPQHCSSEVMLEASKGHIMIKPVLWNIKELPTPSGMTVKNFRMRFDARLQEEKYDAENNNLPDGYSEAPLAYDSVWAVALALNDTIHRLKTRGGMLDQYFSYINPSITNEILTSMNATRFMGVSGEMAFNNHGDRIGVTEIAQLVSGKYKPLGHYDPQQERLSMSKEVDMGVSSSNHMVYSTGMSLLAAVAWFASFIRF